MEENKENEIQKYLEREPIHVLVYGESGSKKSTFAATFPKPILVFFFEALGKDQPYLRAGKISSPRIYEGPYPIREIYNEKGELVIRIEYFRDPDPLQPLAYSLFLSRFAQIKRAIFNPNLVPNEPKWQTIVFDSVTDMELAIRKNAQYRLNPTAKDARQWFGESTNQIEEVLMLSVGSIPINVVTVCHIDEDKDEVGGFMVRNPAFPGRLKKRSAGSYSEFYRAGVKTTEKGERVWYLQTESDSLFNAASQILAPNGCSPDYNALWRG